MYYIILHYITLHYITLHYITLHYTTLHYITLHYITLHDPSNASVSRFVGEGTEFSRVRFGGDDARAAAVYDGLDEVVGVRGAGAM